MDGTTLTLKEKLKQNHSIKNKEKFKFIISILLSNALVCLLCSMMLGPSDKSENLSKNSEIKASSPGYDLIVFEVAANLVAFSEVKSSTDLVKREVTLLNEDKKILIEKAFFRGPVLNSKEKKNDFIFEVRHEDLNRLQENLTQKVIIVPAITLKNKKNKTVTKILSRSKYEVPFKH